MIIFYKLVTAVFSVMFLVSRVYLPRRLNGFCLFEIYLEIIYVFGEPSQNLQRRYIHFVELSES